MEAVRCKTERQALRNVLFRCRDGSTCHTICGQRKDSPRTAPWRSKQPLVKNCPFDVNFYISPSFAGLSILQQRIVQSLRWRR